MAQPLRRSVREAMERLLELRRGVNSSIYSRIDFLRVNGNSRVADTLYAGMRRWGFRANNASAITTP